MVQVYNFRWHRPRGLHRETSILAESLAGAERVLHRLYPETRALPKEHGYTFKVTPAPKLRGTREGK